MDERGSLKNWREQLDFYFENADFVLELLNNIRHWKQTKKKKS